jgi:hypothetical protein
MGTDGRKMMVIWDGRREVVRVGWHKDRAVHIQQRVKDSAAADDDRGATAPPTSSTNARTFERHQHANVCAFALG